MDSFLAFLQNFVAGWTAERLILGAIGIVFTYFPSVSILQWIKNETGWEDLVMHRVVVAFFMVLSALVMLITNEFDPSGVEWTLDNVLVYFGIFSGVAEAAYQRLKTRNGL
jgi:hypothetical protein